MSKTATRALFVLVESFFTEYLPRQRGASAHTVRAYRDALKLLFEFVAQRRGRATARPPEAINCGGTGNSTNSPPDRKAKTQNRRDARKEVASLERTIARFDERKRQLNAQLMETTDAAEALRLHNELTAVEAELRPAEDRWCELQDEVAADDD